MWFLHVLNFFTLGNRNNVGVKIYIIYRHKQKITGHFYYIKKIVYINFFVYIKLFLVYIKNLILLVCFVLHGNSEKFIAVSDTTDVSTQNDLDRTEENIPVV